VAMLSSARAGITGWSIPRDVPSARRAETHPLHPRIPHNQPCTSSAEPPRRSQPLLAKTTRAAPASASRGNASPFPKRRLYTPVRANARRFDCCHLRPPQRHCWRRD
jgi:hypothetical protein